MKKLFLTAALAASLLAGGTATAASHPDKIHRDMQHLKRDYQARVDRQLKGITLQIRRLKHQALKADARARAAIQRETRKLDAQRAGVERKFKDLKKSTGGAWKDLRKGLDESLADLKKSVDAAARRLDPKDAPKGESPAKPGHGSR